MFSLVLCLVTFVIHAQKAEGSMFNVYNLTKCMGLGLVNLKQFDFDSITDSMDPTNPYIHYSSNDLIEAAGYESESHYVETDDGYILNLFRIKRNRHIRNRGVVFLQHGLLSSSDGWLLNHKEKNLAYQLHETGFDVWLGNNRGNIYSRNHTTLDPNATIGEFWDFSWHEMGLYDMPASIEYILSATGEDDLIYVGHSQGCTQYFVGVSLNPWLNSRIRLFVAFAPPVFMADIFSAIRLFASIDEPGVQDNLLCAVGTDGRGSLLSNTQSVLLQYILPFGCDQSTTATTICENLFFLLLGFDFYQTDHDLVTVLQGHSPQGSSMKAIIHYAQLVNNGKFQQFDYGAGAQRPWRSVLKNRLLNPSAQNSTRNSTLRGLDIVDNLLSHGFSKFEDDLPDWLVRNVEGGNLAKYGRQAVPEYDLSRATAPVVLYAGPNDALAVESNVAKIAPLVPGNIDRHKETKYRRVNYNCFNHIDFCYIAKDINDLLNKDVMSVINEYSY